MQIITYNEVANKIVAAGEAGDVTTGLGWWDFVSHCGPKHLVQVHQHPGVRDALVALATSFGGGSKDVWNIQCAATAELSTKLQNEYTFPTQLALF